MGELLSKYAKKGVLIDSNLLVCLFVGMFDPKHLQNCRATKAFTVEDFELLLEFITPFKLIVATPHILTEVSNLAGKLPQNLHTQFRELFRKIVTQIQEEHLPATSVVGDALFPKFGLTDTAITMIAPERFLVLTDEFAMYNLLKQREVDVINFNHLRVAKWSS